MGRKRLRILNEIASNEKFSKKLRFDIVREEYERGNITREYAIDLVITYLLY